MKVLYYGPLFPGSTALHRMQSLQQLGCEVCGIDSALPLRPVGRRAAPLRLARGLITRLDYWFDLFGKRRSLLAQARKELFDQLWVDKGTALKPGTLLKFRSLQPGALLVNYSPDDMFNPANQTERWLQAIPLYDLFVTTKSYNVAEYRAAGAKDVFFVGNAYDPAVHYPRSRSPQTGAEAQAEVCFVGAYEPERARSIELLAQKGYRIKLFGPWEALSDKYPNVYCQTGFFAQDDYVEALSSGAIALCFLRKANRDLQTTRSIEIPACGLFMLAERTDEHLELFEEGKEAEFFDSDEELLRKVAYYLEHPEERQEIACAGRRRCEDSGYSNAERLRAVLDYLGAKTRQA